MSVFLSSDKRTALEAHLRKLIPQDRLRHAVDVLDAACDRAFEDLDRQLDPKPRRKRSADAAHMAAIAGHAGALRELLKAEIPFFEASYEDLLIFDRVLSALHEEAVSNVTTMAPGPRKRGAPIQGWRDRLIASVFTVYPARQAITTDGSHLEQTVRLLLQMLRPLAPDVPKDLHKVIVNARKRQRHRRSTSLPTRQR